MELKHLIYKRCIISYETIKTNDGCITQYKIRYKTHKNKRGTPRTTDIRHECNIFLLKTLNEKKAHAVLVYELTHDYLFHHPGKPVNSKINEGICEAMAGAWLMKHGETELFEQMKSKPPA